MAHTGDQFLHSHVGLEQKLKLPIDHAIIDRADLEKAKWLYRTGSILEALYWAKAIGKNGEVYDKMTMAKINKAIQDLTK